MEAPARRAALYIRVSTLKKAAQANTETGERAYEQNLDLQREPLEQVAHHNGWEVVRCYVDRATGSKESRPGLDELMADARRRAFSVVLVWRFDRFARTVKQLVNALAEFRELGIDFVSTREALDTTTAMGKAMFGIIGIMSELERDIMRERIVAGMAHAAKHGTKSGKPPGRPRRIVDTHSVLLLWEAGHGTREIARMLGVSPSTALRALQKVHPKANPKPVDFGPVRVYRK